jgi:SUMO ligase MMS21 Smc5/6 complex component
MLVLQVEDIVVEIDHFLHYHLLSNIVNHMYEMDQVNKLNHVNVNDVIYVVVTEMVNVEMMIDDVNEMLNVEMNNLIWT